MSVTPPDPVLDSTFPLDHLDDLPLPGRPADAPRIDDDEITLPGHWTSFLAAIVDVLEDGPKGSSDLRLAMQSQGRRPALANGPTLSRLSLSRRRVQRIHGLIVERLLGSGSDYPVLLNGSRARAAATSPAAGRAGAAPPWLSRPATSSASTAAR